MKRAFCSVLLAVSCLSFAASAQPAGGRPQPVQVSLFISPCGEPFRAPVSAPYPVADWFAKTDANHDGAIDKAEMRAQATAFFTKLDLNHDGVITGIEVVAYERLVVPEILGLAPPPMARLDGGRVWLAQYGGDAGSLGGDDPNPGLSPPEHSYHAPTGTTEGAAQFSLLRDAEPVTSADENFDSRITLSEFQHASDRRFGRLDTDEDGKLTLDTLPRTMVQDMVEKRRPKHRS